MRYTRELSYANMANPLVITCPPQMGTSLS